MCKFCEAMVDINKTIKWSVRSTMADDNICEFVNDNNCGLCDDCEMSFELYGYEHEDNIFVGIEYYHKLKAKDGQDVVIMPFSETIQFNFCPFCGDQISKNVKSASDYSEYYISIEGKSKE